MVESKGTVTREWILDGHFMREDVKASSDFGPFEGLGILGYNNVDGQYEFVWFENQSTAVMMETGAYNLYGTYSYGPYGGSWWTGLGHSTTPESIDANVNESKKNVRFTEMKNIEDGYTEIRQALTQKYQIEF